MDGSLGIGNIILVLAMHANIWNIRNSKQRLGIIQRTQAHKRHLESILLAKSSINTRATHTPRSPSRPTRTQNSPTSSDSSLLRTRTAQSSSRLKQRYVLAKSQVDLSASLSVYSSVTRQLRRREIEEENSKLLSRLMGVPATLKRKSWVRMQEQHQVYKENIRRRKCGQVDYSEEALKMIRGSTKFRLILSRTPNGVPRPRPRP